MRTTRNNVKQDVSSIDVDDKFFSIEKSEFLQSVLTDTRE